MRSLLAIVLLLGACAHGLKPVQPTIDKRGFLELTTPHFRLVTDLDAASATRRIQQLEQSWWAIVDIYELLLPGRTVPESSVVQAIHFRDCDFLRAAAPKLNRVEILSYVIPTPDFQENDLVVSCERKGERNDEDINRQVVVRLQAHLFDTLPAWLEQGIAQFLASIVVGADTVTLGERPRIAVLYWGQYWLLPTLERLRTLTPYEFASYNSSNDFAAWVAVHLFFTKSEPYRDRFRRQLSALAAGASPEEAWARSFGDLPIMPTQREFLDYVERKKLRSFTFPYRPRPPVTPRVRTLRAGEAHGAWLELLVWGREWLGDEAAWSQLELATKADPTWAGLPLWRAIVYAKSSTTKGVVDPTPELRAAADADPAATTPRLALVELALRRLVPKDHLGVEATAPPGLEELEPDVRVLARTAQTALELATVARYFALRRLPQPALVFAERAVKEHPACVPCHDVLGLVYFQLGRTPQAIAEAERAVGRAQLHLGYQQKIDPDLEKRLAHYRAGSR